MSYQKIKKKSTQMNPLIYIYIYIINDLTIKINKNCYKKLLYYVILSQNSSFF